MGILFGSRFMKIIHVAYRIYPFRNERINIVCWQSHLFRCSDVNSWHCGPEHLVLASQLNRGELLSMSLAGKSTSAMESVHPCCSIEGLLWRSEEIFGILGNRRHIVRNKSYRFLQKNRIKAIVPSAQTLNAKQREPTLDRSLFTESEKQTFFFLPSPYF